MSQTRKPIIPYKQNQVPCSVSRKGVFSSCITANEQGEVGEGYAIGLLSGFPRYIQNVTKASGGCPYDVVGNLVCMDKIIGIQVKTTANHKIQLSGNSYTAQGSQSTLSNFNLVDAVMIVHCRPRYYFIPMKELLKHPSVINRMSNPSSNSPIRFAYDKKYAKFEIIHGQIPEIFKYEDYWI